MAQKREGVKYLTKEELLAGRVREANIDGYGAVFIRPPSTARMIKVRTSDEALSAEMMRDIVSECIVDEGGKPMFTRDEMGEVDWAMLGMLSDAIWSSLNKEPLKLSGEAVGNVSSGEEKPQPSSASPTS